MYMYIVHTCTAVSRIKTGSEDLTSFRGSHAEYLMSCFEARERCQNTSLSGFEKFNFDLGWKLPRKPWSMTSDLWHTISNEIPSWQDKVYSRGSYQPRSKLNLPKTERPASGIFQEPRKRGCQIFGLTYTQHAIHKVASKRGHLSWSVCLQGTITTRL